MLFCVCFVLAPWCLFCSSGGHVGYVPVVLCNPFVGQLKYRLDAISRNIPASETYSYPVKLFFFFFVLSCEWPGLVGGGSGRAPPGQDAGVWGVDAQGLRGNGEVVFWRQ